MDPARDTRNLRLWLGAALLALSLSLTLGILWRWQPASLWLQLIGGVVTLVGLLYAYLHAKHPGDTLRQQLEGFWRRLLGQQRRDVRVVAASGIISMEAFGYAEVSLENHPELDLQQQIDELNNYIRTYINPRFKDVYHRLQTTDHAVKRVEQTADDKANEAYSKASADLTKLRKELDRSTALDLRWAIFGVYIATIGLAFSVI